MRAWRSSLHEAALGVAALAAALFVLLDVLLDVLRMA
jgi:hypothetical protein